MLQFVATSQFRRDSKRVQRRGLDISRLGVVVDMLLRGYALPAQCRDHGLAGRYKGHRECHIGPDWLFVYRVASGRLIAIRTGTHSDLFGL